MARTALLVIGSLGSQTGSPPRRNLLQAKAISRSSLRGAPESPANRSGSLGTIFSSATTLPVVKAIRA